MHLSELLLKIIVKMFCCCLCLFVVFPCNRRLLLFIVLFCAKQLYEGIQVKSLLLQVFVHVVKVRDAPLDIHYGNQMILQLNKRISSL